MDSITKIVVVSVGLLVLLCVGVGIHLKYSQTKQLRACSDQGGVIAKIIDSDDYTANRICIEQPRRLAI